MRVQRRQKSIITQTVFRVSVVFIGALLLLTVIFSAFTGNYMKDNIIDNKMEQVETIADAINADIDSLTSPMISLAAYGPAVRLLRNADEKYTQNWMQNIRNLDSYLTNINLFYGNVVDILLISSESEVVYCMSDNMKVNYDYPVQDWFQEALLQDSLIKYGYHQQAEHFYRDKKDYTVSCIYPVKQGDRLRGYLLFEYDLSGYVGYFREQPGSRDGFLMIDSNGKKVFDYNDGSRQDGGREFLYEKLIKSEVDSFQYNRNLYLVRRLPVCNWYVVSETAYSIILEPIGRLLVIVGAVILLTVIFLILISFYNMKKIRKPMDTLVSRIESFDGSSVPEKYSLVNAPVELSVIGSKFDEMAEHTNNLIQDVYLAQLAKKEMELEAMVNQINPHFLYNVFQLIQTEAVMADNTAIEGMIQALSNMMRYTMERKREKVLIRQELEYIRDYLMFYKERFPELFTYTVNCEPGAEQYETIKFILQPVLENCFKHGFKCMKKGGLITIHIFKNANDVYFKVRDNGIGIEAAKLVEIREALQGEADGSGIGIVNTNARLRLVYGPSYGITFESEMGRYTEVTIRIKAEKSNYV